MELRKRVTHVERQEREVVCEGRTLECSIYPQEEFYKNYRTGSVLVLDGEPFSRLLANTSQEVPLNDETTLRIEHVYHSREVNHGLGEIVSEFLNVAVIRQRKGYEDLVFMQERAKMIFLHELDVAEYELCLVTSEHSFLGVDTGAWPVHSIKFTLSGMVSDAEHIGTLRRGVSSHAHRSPPFTIGETKNNGAPRQTVLESPDKAKGKLRERYYALRGAWKQEKTKRPQSNICHH